ncbi:hypothetical protein [Gordonia insulae]|uniref:MmpS family membrane protein n=1 Tax=Gordonia insulae TaxID=2420509 RepID=A0A3G8JHW5_9ACTN|nr:hypothetical protein [Gordonia insulae]AZG44498.1 hypothetical protein D7316_01084 [Gordonia insulae]
MSIRGLGVIASIAMVAAVTAGCGIEGDPVGADASPEVTMTQTTPAPTTPTGPAVGTATMQVTGSGQATVRYSVNGAAEQTESDVSLPWQKQFPVYDELETTISADGGAAELSCTITMDGKLVAYKTEPRPTCEFAYWG